MELNKSPDCASCEFRGRSIFCVLGKEDADRLNVTRQPITVKKGEVIFKEGCTPRGLYCVFSGKVKITQMGSGGKDQILHLAREGDILGYRAILGSDTYSCTATAIENTLLCYIPKEIFLPMVETKPKLALEIINLFSSELRIAEQQITRLTQKPVKERVAQGILLLVKNFGFEEGSNQINVNITREEIANIAGTTRETAIRVLYALNKNGVIQLNGKKIKVLNYGKLDHAANLLN